MYEILFVLVVILCVCPDNQATTPEQQPHQLEEDTSDLWLVNYPDIFKELNHSIGHQLTMATSNQSYIEKADFIRTLNPTKPKFISTDFEALFALENFFWGMTGGLSLELGALDGSIGNAQAASQTGDFEEFGWDRIIIEANPDYREDMKKHSPKALGINAAICNPKSRHHGKEIHYVYRGGARSPSAGIPEFMSTHFLKTFYPFLLDSTGELLTNLTSLNNLPEDTKIIEIQCVSLQKVLDKAKVSHVNFFVLDVEGGEIEVLHSINWHRTSFDVLCIETDPEHRKEGYAHHVSHYLQQRGYNHVYDDRRNSWYVHQGLFDKDGFTASRRPMCCPKPNTQFFPWTETLKLSHEYSRE